MAEPAVTVQANYYSNADNRPIQRVVIHATSPSGAPGTSSSASGMAHGTALYFTTAAAGGSAHYITDVNGEEHCVADKKIAYHAPPNTHSIGIEICGQTTYTRQQWLSPEVWPAVVRAQTRAREVCHRHGVPWVRLTVADLKAGHHGVCGHVDVSIAFRQSTHSDPGVSFPWDMFLAEPAPPPTPIRTPEDDSMPQRFFVDAKGVDDLGRDSHWEVTFPDGNILNWNGARPLGSLGQLAPNHPPIVAAYADPTGDGLVLVAGDGHQDDRGHWVTSTYKILAG